MTTTPEAEGQTLRRILTLIIIALASMAACFIMAATASAVSSVPALPITSTSTPAPTSPATFQPYGLTCAWVLGAGATAAHPFDDGHGKAVPQTFFTCITATTGPSPACGKTVTEQVDHYTFTTAKMAADFAALVKTGVLNSPAEDAEFSPHDWTYPTITGPECVTPTPTPTTSTPTPTPSTSTPIPTPSVTTTPPSIHLGTTTVSVAPVPTPVAVVATPDALASTGAGNGWLGLLVVLGAFLLVAGYVFVKAGGSHR